MDSTRLLWRVFFARVFFSDLCTTFKAIAAVTANPKYFRKWGFKGEPDDYLLAHGPSATDVSGCLLRTKEYPSLRESLWGTRSVAAVLLRRELRGVLIEIIRLYVEQQQMPH